MSWFRALLLSIGCLLLAVGSSFASPPVQNVECEISSWLPGIQLPYAPYVREEQLAVAGHQLTLRVCAPYEHSLTGDQALNQLKTALPRLNELAGVPLNGSFIRPLVIASEQTMPAGVDGLLDNEGVIYVRSTSPESTVVHEGAHYWANSHNFGEQWMIEGYAEYLTEEVTGLKRPYIDTQPCEHVPLMNWDYEPRYTVVCGYVVGAAVFRDLAAAIGPDTLRSILSEERRNYGPISSWQLMVSAERASSSSLSHLFRGRVFPASMNDALDQRDALHSRLDQAELLLSDQRIPMLPILRESFNNGDFATADQWLNALVPVLERTGSIIGSCSRLNLTCKPYWQPLPDSIAGLETLHNELTMSHMLLGQYSTLRTLAQNSGIEPTQLHQEIGKLDPQLLTAVQDSVDMLRFGQSIALRCQGLQIECTQWQQSWAQHQLAASRQQIDQLMAMLDKVPLLERTCAAKGWPCEQSWRNTFKRTNSPAKTLAVMEQISDNLDELSALANLTNKEPQTYMPLLGANVSDTLDEAHLAFADGDVAGALALANEARLAQARSQQLPSWMLGLTAVLGVLAVGWAITRQKRKTSYRFSRMPQPKRQPVKQPVSDQQFLEELLK